MTKTCGTCHFGKINPKDLNVRICWGGPPQTIMHPAGNGQMAISSVRPNVRATDEACSFWEPRTLQEIANDESSKDALEK